MAVKDCYTNYQTPDYNSKYDMLAPKTVISETVIDHDRFGDNTPDYVDPLEFVPSIAKAKSLTFRYQAHKTSNNNQRDTLRYGLLDCEQQYQLWGFETYLEFRSHLARCDKSIAKQAWEELKCDIAGTHAKCLFWLPKNDQALTRPGCWAITIDQNSTRYALVRANQDWHLFKNLRQTKQNIVRINS